MDAPQCVKEQEQRLYDALSADNKGCINAETLANALGEGISRHSITNAAFEGLLPFGFGHRSDLKGKRNVTIPKGAVWNWYQKMKG